MGDAGQADGCLAGFRAAAQSSLAASLRNALSNPSGTRTARETDPIKIYRVEYAVGATRHINPATVAHPMPNRHVSRAAIEGLRRQAGWHAALPARSRELGLLDAGRLAGAAGGLLARSCRAAPRYSLRDNQDFVASILSCVFVSKSLASCRSCSCSDGSPITRLTMRPRLTAGRARIASAQRITFL